MQNKEKTVEGRAIASKNNGTDQGRNSSFRCEGTVTTRHSHWNNLKLNQTS